MSIWIFFKLIGALALLMFGMKSMSDSLQKMAGPQLRHVLEAQDYRRLHLRYILYVPRFGYFTPNRYRHGSGS